jgi:hypothetical protein
LIPVSNHVSQKEGSFDDWLEAGLRRELAPMALRPAPAPRYRIRDGRARRRGLSIFTGTSAALGAKAVTGFAVTAFAVAATGTAVSHSANPFAWRDHVQTAVTDCRLDLANSGRRGIGDCVSSMAGQVQPQGPAPVVEEHPSPVAKPVTPARVEQAQPPAVAKTPQAQKPDAKTPVKTLDPRTQRYTPRPLPTGREGDHDGRGE